MIIHKDVTGCHECPFRVSGGKLYREICDLDKNKRHPLCADVKYLQHGCPLVEAGCVMIYPKKKQRS